MSDLEQISRCTIYTFEELLNIRREVGTDLGFKLLMRSCACFDIPYETIIKGINLIKEIEYE